MAENKDHLSRLKLIDSVFAELGGSESGQTSTGDDADPSIEDSEQDSTSHHSEQDNCGPTPGSSEPVATSAPPPSVDIEVGSVPRHAEAEQREVVQDTCLMARSRVVGCDFGAPKRAGEQARKIILIEAVQVGEGKYAIEPTGRNERLRLPPYPPAKTWKQNRPGWTLPDLLDSLSVDRSIKVVAFDFPFSIPIKLLKDPKFAGRLHQEPFETRDRWLEFVDERLAFEFDGVTADAMMESLGRFEAWKDKEFWIQRLTDEAASGSPPLKHQFQNVFSMTLAGVKLLSRLSSAGYTTVLDSPWATAAQSLVETNPREVAKRIGFDGSYKVQPQACLARALEYLASQNIELEVDHRVREFCEQYRTSKTDPDGADAFLCLVSAICFHECKADLIQPLDADSATLREEGAILVPSSC